jgi:mannitol/fructose-specific phosphotransferase system IIA component (Ntr-type)
MQGIKKALSDREQEASTAITGFTAVPHLVVDGEEVFGLVLVRAKRGIRFSPDREQVKAVFVLYGSRDERLFHLQALASVAQTILNPLFEERWLNAKDERGLRDVVLLSERKRIND